MNTPGIEFREMNEADWCCGGAGSYSLSHYRLARRIIDRKASNIAHSGAHLAVTSCPACMIHLDYGLRINNIPVKVAHISQVLQGSAT
jgi:glycolate oxidase iron-sulfur subunit